MDTVHDIVIVGGGITGLATSLGLHRLGIKSLVLESADSLRTTGFAFVVWTNAWKALDALGLGQMLRPKHNQLTGFTTTEVDTGTVTAAFPFSSMDSKVEHDVRCMNRKLLMETLESELPAGTISYSSKVVHIENAGYFKSVHLADGNVLKTKVLLGCDGVNSVVAEFLGLSKPPFVGRLGYRGFVHFKDGHSVEPKFMEFFGKGFKYGIMPCDDHTVYWFFTYSPSAQEKESHEDPTKMKEYILSKLGKVPDNIRTVFENTELNNMVGAPLRFRRPWELLWGNISKDGICVAGDALHAMTPDLGQGACSAIEDSVVLARTLGEAMKKRSSGKEEDDTKDEHRRICKGLEKFAGQRKWRGFDLISTAYMVGFVQQNESFVVNFLRDWLGKYIGGMLMKKARFDCGNLTES